MSLLDLDAMLTTNMESVEAAPEFVRLENGVYDLDVVKVEAKKREAKDKAKATAEGKATEWYDLVLTYAVANTVTMENTNLLPPKPGSLIQENFQFTDKGLPYFKSRVAAIVVAMGGSEADANAMSPKDVIDSFPGAAKFRATVKKTVDKLQDKDFEKNKISGVVAIPA